MLTAVGLAFALLVAGACARSGFRYGWARLRELHEALDTGGKEIHILAPPTPIPQETIWRLPGDVQLHGWFSHRDPKTLPEYLPHHASSEYDEAMRGYGDIKFSGKRSPEHLHAAWQRVQDVMRRQYEQMIVKCRQEYESRAV